MINLLSLNGYVSPTKFMMETVSLILRTFRKGDVMFSIDLKDTNFQIPVHQDSPPYLCLPLSGKVFKIKALCFNLSTAPKVFTRAFSLVLESAHWRGICLRRLICYSRVSVSPARTSQAPVSGPSRHRDCYQFGEVRL